VTASAPAPALPRWTVGTMYDTSTHAERPRDGPTLRTA